MALAEWLSITYGDAGITVSCLCPQGGRTPMLDVAMEDPVGAAPLLAGGLMEPDDVAAAVVEGLRDERFLILPHPEVANHMALKGAQPERWLKGMRKLVRQARVPSIAALNPEVDPEIEQVVRKALARDPEERYQSANDLGDALAQFLFSRRMKVTARDISNLVRDAQVEMMRKRSAEPKDSLIDALILDEMQKMTSLVNGSGAPTTTTNEGSMSLDPSAFVDTSAWVSELELTTTQAPSKRSHPARPQAPKNRPSAHPPTPSPEIEPLENILEPDRTGIHRNRERKPPWALLVVIMLLLAAAAAVAVIIAMK